MLGRVLREDKFINSLTGIGTDEADVLGIGDDAALLSGYLISTDIITEGVHFLAEEGEKQIARRLVASNVSDICAMGGLGGGYYALLGAGFSSVGKVSPLAFSSAFRRECGEYGITLLGGDTVKARSTFFSLTIIGRSNNFILKRSGAAAGDILYLSRPVGRAQAALKERLAGIFKAVSFPPEIKLGELLGGIGTVSSCIDISDGLGVDLAHISEASGIAFELSGKDIPLAGEVSLKDAAESGEEYALAFTVSPDGAQYAEDAARKLLNRKIYRIGIAAHGTGVYLDGEEISGRGYRHEF
jgi:thiamine-monophosphate kinase